MSNNTISFFNGLTSGAIGAFGVYPIDVVKTRMQNQSNINRIYKNGFDCWKQLWAQGTGVSPTTFLGRFKPFYRGVLVQTVGVGPEKAVKLFAYTLATKNHQNEFIYHLYGGLLAGFCQVSITNPYELIKINLQMGTRLNINELLNFKKLYRGACACYLRDVPFSGIYFPLYWSLKQETNPFIAGTLAGAPAAFLCTPADVIKTRMQTLSKENKPKMVNTVKNIYEKEGWTAFFKGGGWRVCRSAPQFGITLLAYELLQDFFN